MEFLNILLKDSALEPSVRDEVTRSYKAIKEKVKKAGIVMDKDAELMFSNHILALLKRIKTHSLVEGMEGEFDQISPPVFKMAEDLIGEYFGREEIPVEPSEVFLVATHLEMAIQKKEEQKNE